MNLDVRPVSPLKYGFLLTPGFSMLALSSAIEVLRVANKVSREKIYEWPLIAIEGTQVTASNGITMQAQFSLSSLPSLNALIVVGGVDVDDAWSSSLGARMRAYADKGTVLGGICTGAVILARAGLLERISSTIHWEYVSGLRALINEGTVTGSLYEIEGDVCTSSGGIAPIQMMTELVATRQSRQLALKVADQMSCDRQQGGSSPALEVAERIGVNQPKLTEAVELMEANLEELLGVDEVAALVGISRRQLERLFKKYLGSVPRRYYLELRLKKARSMVLQTPNSIAEIASSCGFVSASHFSKSYKEVFGVTPSAERQHHSHQVGHKLISSYQSL